MAAKASLFTFVLSFLSVCLDMTAQSKELSENLDKFQFNRIEPGNELGILTKVITHVHRPEKKLTESWRLNREFTPAAVLDALTSMCSDKLIEKTIKWSNCELTEDGLYAELTYGVPEHKNKTIQYIEMSFKPFQRIENGVKKTCSLAIVEENPVYFLLETFSKLPANDTFPRKPEESVETVHQHQLGKFGPQFLSIFGNVINQDGIYNFDMDDYYEREEPYDCFLSIGSSESASVIESKCQINCEETKEDSVHNEL